MEIDGVGRFSPTTSREVAARKKKADKTILIKDSISFGQFLESTSENKLNRVSITKKKSSWRLQMGQVPAKKETEKSKPTTIKESQQVTPTDDRLDLFYIREGLSSNYFFQGDKVDTHVMLTDGPMGRIYTSFPSANSGCALRFDPEDPATQNLKLEYAGKPEEFSTGENDQGVAFDVKTNQPRLAISDIHLDSIRLIRDLKQPSRVEKRLKAKEEFLKYAKLPQKGYLYPDVKIGKKDGKTVVELARKTLDDKNRFYTRLTLPQNAGAKIEDGKLILSTNDSSPLRFNVSTSVDYKPLTPYKENELLDKTTAAYRENLAKTDPAKKQRFDRALKALSFLSYKEKFLAGSWRFLTYFGRDTMMSLMLLKDSVTPQVYESSMQSVLDRLSDRGDVAHEEDIGSQAIARRLDEYVNLKKEGKNTEAEKVKKHLSDPIYDYKMVDDDFMLPLMIGEYVGDGRVFPARCREFFEKKNARGEKNVEAVLKNFNNVLRKSQKYARSRNPATFIRIQEGEKVGDWRDSPGGLGNGVYPGSVNVHLVHNSLAAIKKIIDSGLYSKRQLETICEEHNLNFIHDAIKSPRKLDNYVEVWKQGRKKFEVNLSPDQVRNRLKDYMESHPMEADEKQNLLGREIEDGITIKDFIYGNKTPGVLKDGLSFYALSLDENKKPVEVMNSDTGFALFNGNPEPREIRKILKTVNLPYPLGLSEKGGLLTANPVFSSDKSLRKSLDRNAYHGTVVWSWQMALMEKGLIKQIDRFSSDPSKKQLVREMYETLAKLRKMERNSGNLVNSELWTHKMVDGEMKPVAYGSEASSETESNPVQLWSTVALSTMEGYDRIKNQMLENRK